MKEVKKMTIEEMMLRIIENFGHESDITIGFCEYAESDVDYCSVYGTYTMICATYNIKEW